ncbi:glycosyltransferase family 4 protein [Halobacillus halophilus]|uniref:glycosyltransferase family 4 protein n=1 Tax=Halobacillus halophilus TaxID=1570 RepID=UPI001CD7E17D|nr:glycosyltransferase family 1 protein [Halobacillus halophilus]MCA1009544.1 glycosyltransferase family 1 protein [Halobacillus halophilus]
MKIAIFSDTYTPQVNGVSRTLGRLIKQLEKEEIEYRLFIPQLKDSPSSNCIRPALSFPFLLYPECRLSLPSAVRIRKELTSFNPDIVHIATPFSMGLTGLYCAKKLNIPIVGSYHTNFDRYLEYYNLQYLSKWMWKYLKWFYRDFQRTFVPSYHTRTELNLKGFHNIAIWSRGVDCTRFHPSINNMILKDYDDSKPTFLLTYVGRVAPEKDLDILMDVARDLPEPYKNKVHWLIVGEGPLLKELQKEKLPNITFTGYVHGSELANIYANSTLFIFPSTTETFGNVVLEALACGTPVVASKSGGVQEIIQSGKTGILCDPRNSSQMIDAICNLLADPLRIQTMAMEARKYALDQSWETILSKLLNEYKEVIDQSFSSHTKLFMQS